MNVSNDVAVLQATSTVPSARLKRQPPGSRIRRSSRNAADESVCADTRPRAFPSFAPQDSAHVVSAAALGFLLGIALALCLEARTPLIRSAEDLSAVVELPLLVTLPRVARLRRTRAAPRLASRALVP